jgi:hypothetical protein
MLTSRITFVLVACGFVVWILWTFRNVARRAEQPGLACPRCSYTLDGLAEGGCPECGRPWTVEKVRVHNCSQIKAEVQAAAVIVSVLLAAIHFFVARDLLEIRRLLIVGDFAFVPGYSRFEPVEATLALPLGFAVLSFLASIVYIVSTYYGVMNDVQRRQEKPAPDGHRP